MKKNDTFIRHGNISFKIDVECASKLTSLVDSGCDFTVLSISKILLNNGIESTEFFITNYQENNIILEQEDEKVFSVDCYADGKFLFSCGQTCDFSLDGVFFVNYGHGQKRVIYNLHEKNNDGSLNIKSYERMFENGLIYRRKYATTCAKFTVMYKDYCLECEIRDKSSFDDKKHVNNEEKLEEYFGTLEFPVSIVDVYNRICEITLLEKGGNGSKISIKKGDVELERLAYGERNHLCNIGTFKTSFGLEENVGTVTFYSDENWAYERTIMYNGCNGIISVGLLKVEKKNGLTSETFSYYDGVDPQIVEFYRRMQMPQDLKVVLQAVEAARQQKGNLLIRRKPKGEI